MGRASDRIYPHATHERHVEHESAVANCKPRDVVPPSLDRQHETTLAREVHACDDVPSAEAARNEGGPAVDHCVPSRAGIFVARMTWKQKVAAKAVSKMLNLVRP